MANDKKKSKKAKKKQSTSEELSPREQLQWYFDQAAAGDEQAKRELGRMYSHGFTHPDEPSVELLPDAKQAKQWLTEAADAGDGEAALLLGILLDGEATQAPFDDPAEAFRRYQQAVDRECRDALPYLGTRYLIGRGTERNDCLGREILIEAAYGGDEPAQRFIAEIYAKDGDARRANAWRIVRGIFHEDADMPKEVPKESLEMSRLIIQKVNIYSKIVLCDAPELMKAADVLRQGFFEEIRQRD